MLESFISYAPTRLVFGQGSRKEIAQTAAKYGKRVMLFLDPFFAASPLGDEIRESLVSALEHVELFTDIAPNPDHISVDRASAVCSGAKCDLIVVVGGGSAIDTAKAVSIVAPYGGKCWDYTERKDACIKQPDGPGLPVIAVPTTAGTGSETTRFAVISNHELHAKCTIYNDAVIPNEAFIDPELMLSMPKDLTLYTGIDTFAHSLESMLTARATPYSLMIAKQSLELFGKSFKRCLADGNDVDAKGDMAFASTLAGIAISHTSTSLPHAFSQTFSGLVGAPHGASIACCLSEVLRWTLPHCEEAFSMVARMIDPSLVSASDGEAAAMLPGLIDGMLKSVGCACTFGAFGLTEDQIPEFIKQMLIARQKAINSYPRTPNEDDIRNIILRCM